MDHEETSCCRRKKGLKELEMSFADLLGVVSEPPQLRFVHCPLRRKGRAREDVILEVAEALDGWAAAVSAKCHAGPRSYVVFINPCSGSGRALAQWRLAKELLELLPWIELREHVTTEAGEAEREAEKLGSGCDGVIVVSGDGMVHEVWRSKLGHGELKTT